MERQIYEHIMKMKRVRKKNLADFRTRILKRKSSTEIITYIH